MTEGSRSRKSAACSSAKAAKRWRRQPDLHSRSVVGVPRHCRGCAWRNTRNGAGRADKHDRASTFPLQNIEDTGGTWGAFNLGYLEDPAQRRCIAEHLLYSAICRRERDRFGSLPSHSGAPQPICRSHPRGPPICTSTQRQLTRRFWTNSLHRGNRRLRARGLMQRATSVLALPSIIVLKALHHVEEAREYSDDKQPIPGVEQIVRHLIALDAM